LTGIGSYAVYYGHGRLEELAGFDLVVVEPAAHRSHAIAGLRSVGVMVLAYMSALEVPRSTYRSGPADERLWVRGAPLHNPAFDNWVLAPTPVRARDLVDRAQQLARHYDGVFLDTLGAVEDERIPAAERLRLALAAGHLVRTLRQAWPQGRLVQNMGIWGVHRFTRDYVDGLCWEAFPPHPDLAPAWTAAKCDELEAWAGSQRRVLALLADGPLLDADWVQSLTRPRDFLTHVAPGDYTSAVGRAL
jgi:hypothetical protein